MRKVVQRGIFSFGLIMLSVWAAYACSCREKASACEGYGGSEAVFVGMVVEGKRVERMSEMIAAGTDALAFKFAVSRAFVGAKKGDVITVHTGFGFGDCGFPFQAGEEYIVYAYANKGKLRTGICSRTTHISRAADDLKELDMVARNSGAKVSGSVTRYERSSMLGEPFLPFANHIIRLIRSSDSKTFETRTKPDGKYEFANLPGGRYRIGSFLDIGWELDDYETEEFLLNKHGCATRDMSIENDMSAKVIVLDPEGNPVPSVWVEWVPVGVNTRPNRYWEETGVTNPEGQSYEFDIPPGTYTVSINYFHAPDKDAPFPTTFSPGVGDRAIARIVEIKPGSKIGDIMIRVPWRLEFASVTGTVVWPDGKPASGVEVGLTDLIAGGICVNGCGTTDAQGQFRLSGYAGREYKIWVRGDKTLSGNELVHTSETGVFTITKSLQPLRLTLRRAKE